MRSCAALTRAVFVASLLLALPFRAFGQHIAVWTGGGVGFFLHGGPGISGTNGHKFGTVAIRTSGEGFALRYVQGSLERSQGIPADTGDNDLDYFGFDAVVGRKVTRLPVDLAFGFSRFEEAYHEGYPDRDLGGRVFVHRWGPHVSALRSVRFLRFFEAWGEADLHYAPYRPRQEFLLLNAGLGLRF